MNRQTKNTIMKAIVLLIGSISALILTFLASKICPQLSWLWTILVIILIGTTVLNVWILIRQWRENR